MKSLENLLTIICVTTSCAICLLALGLLLYNYFFYSGNHWFLFGTWVDKLLNQNKTLCAIGGALPLLIPVIFKASKQNLLISLSGVVVFLFLLYCFHLLTD